MHKIDKVRALSEAGTSMQTHAGETDETSMHLFNKLEEEIENLSLDEAMPLIRAGSHYLNLTSIAEIHHRVRTYKKTQVFDKGCEKIFPELLSGSITAQQLHDTVSNAYIEPVLTAHPTQVNRRTLQFKHTRVAKILDRNEKQDLTQGEREFVFEDLLREIRGIWETDELRRRQVGKISSSC